MKTNFFHSRPKKKPNTFQQLLKSKQAGMEVGVTTTVQQYSAVLLLCLKDKFGFTPEQLQDVALHINETFDCINEGYLSLNDITQVLKEEDGIDVRFLK